MTNRTMNPDKALDAISESMRSLGAENLLDNAMSGSKDRIIMGLLTDFRSKSLTTEQIWAGIGALNELDLMHQRLQRSIRAGHRVTEQLGADNAT